VKNVAEGTHEKLLNECMTYKELFEKNRQQLVC
jgi:hypothetical protein